MLKRIVFPFILLGILYSGDANAQERILHGVVTTLDRIPLVGASVKVHSTKQVVLTDSLGRFSVVCDKDDRLKVYGEGFYNQKIKLTGKTKFAAINLHLNPHEKDRKIDIGYGKIRDDDKLNAVSTLSDDEFDFNRYDNIYDLIRGKFAGVQVENKEIFIRGSTSLRSSNAALIVIDGVIADESILSTIKPIEVKSINIIKDGSSAVYGVRGANGVVIVNTKHGGD